MIQGDKSDKREYYRKDYEYLEIVPKKKFWKELLGIQQTQVLRRILKEDKPLDASKYMDVNKETSIWKSGKVFIYEENGIAYEFFSGKSLGSIKGKKTNLGYVSSAYKRIVEYGFEEMFSDEYSYDSSYLYRYSSEYSVNFFQDAQTQTEQDKKQALIYLELRKEYHQRREKERLRREKEKLEKEQQAASWGQNIISQRGK